MARRCLTREQRARRRRRGLARAAAIALVALLLHLYAHHVEPSWIEVTRHEVALPVARPLKLAHLSDVHTIGLWRKEQKVLALLAEERPDVIVLTGDTLHQGGTFEETRPFLSQLRAPLGVFAVAGNWDASCRDRLPAGKSLRAFFEECGVRLLKNEHVEIAPGLCLVGFDDFCWGKPDLAHATDGLDQRVVTIGLVHEPAFFDQAAGAVDVLLAGHTHGGQVRIPFVPPLYLPNGCGDYLAGWYEQRGSRMYVSRGIGMSGAKYRFLCRPELAIHLLTPAPAR